MSCIVRFSTHQRKLFLRRATENGICQAMADATRGAALLRQALRPKPKMTTIELATKLMVSRQAVSDWLSGKTRPDPKHWKGLEEALGIPPTAWLESEES
jgi:ribosome-binding protein aMBF1 (putative translation factor)